MARCPVDDRPGICLVLCDLGLPGLDGVDLARAIRAAGIRVPLLAVSGRASEDERLIALTAGFDSFLVKPFSATTLLREVALHEAARSGQPVALASLANLPEFFEAFSCDGGAMARPKELRPTIW